MDKAEFCQSKCVKGKELVEQCLKDCESVFDAVFDFQRAVEKCYLSPDCPLYNNIKETEAV